MLSFISVLLSLYALAVAAGSTQSGHVGSAWIPMKHRFSHLPESSMGGRAMSRSHFEKLKNNDRMRQRWLSRNNYWSGRVERGRKTAQVNSGVELLMRGSADSTTAVGSSYIITVSLGTPSKSFSVEIDTGSDLFWVNCEPCVSCPTSSSDISLAAPFDPSKSSTSNKTSCSSEACIQITNGCTSSSTDCLYDLMYGDGSESSGTLYYDTLSLSGLNSTTVQATVPVGCSYNLTSNFLDPTLARDGLIGLGRASYSVPSVLASENVLAATFSICLGGEAKGGGTLIFGTQPSLGSNPQSTPMVDTNITSLYYVTVTGISVGGTALSGVDSSTFGTPDNRAGTIFDSGTTLALVPKAVYTAMANQLVSIVTLQQLTFGETSGLYCWNYPDSTTANIGKYFPNASIEFDGGASMNLTPDNYILLSSLSLGGQAACFQWQNSGIGPATSILGDLILRNKLITFDNVNSKLSWAEFDCSGTNPIPSEGAISSSNDITSVKSSADNKPCYLSSILVLVFATFCCILQNFV